MSVARYVPFEAPDAAVGDGEAAHDLLSHDSRYPDARVGLFPDYGKGEEFRQFQRAPDKTLATIATLAGGGPERPWSAGLRFLLAMPVPIGITDQRWEELQFDAARFDRDWGAQALAAGWSTLDAYGISTPTTAARVDGHGAVALLRGRLILSLDARRAIIDVGQGRTSSFYISAPSLSSRALWDAFAHESGP